MRRARAAGAALALLLGAGTLGAQAAGRRSARADSTVVITLGTGMPFPDPRAQGPGTAVAIGGRVFLFDAGPGVMRQMRAAALPIRGPEALFITHLHTDHTLGLPDLIFTSWVMGRRAPLQAYGPRGLRAMTEHLIAAFAEDTLVRIRGLERQTPGGYRVDAREIRPGLVYDRDGVRVRAIPVPHGTWREAYGYRIETRDRVVVISGDTRPSSALAEAARGVDVLVHEVYPEARLAPEQRPGGEEWPSYMRTFHTSDVELGRLAAAARPKLLVLTHGVLMGGSPAELVAGVRRGGYQGRVVVAKDLDRF